MTAPELELLLDEEDELELLLDPLELEAAVEPELVAVELEAAVVVVVAVVPLLPLLALEVAVEVEPLLLEAAVELVPELLLAWPVVPLEVLARPVVPLLLEWVPVLLERVPVVLLLELVVGFVPHATSANSARERIRDGQDTRYLSVRSASVGPSTLGSQIQSTALHGDERPARPVSGLKGVLHPIQCFAALGSELG